MALFFLFLLPFPVLAFNFLFLIPHKSFSSSSFCLPHLLNLSCLPPALLPSTSPHHPRPSPPGRLGLAASYLSVKALVPQMPKLLKSLFPARDDKKELRPSPHSQQVRKGRCSCSRWCLKRQFYTVERRCSSLVLAMTTLSVVTLQHVPRIMTSGGDDSRVKAESVRLSVC